MPKVAIILSTKNRGYVIAEAIESVLSQTYQDFQFFIMDDGSTDDTKTILSQYSSNYGDRFEIHTREKSVGTTPNAKYLIEISKSDYIARIDDDDIWFPEKLEKQVWFLDEHEDIWVAWTATEVIDSKGGSIANHIPSCSDRDIRKKILMVNQFAHSSVLFRRKAYDEAWWYNPDFTTEDYELWTRMGTKGWKFANLPEILTQIRISEGQITQKKRRRLILSELRVLWKYKRHYPGFSKALLSKVWALLLSPWLSPIIGRFMRKYMWF